MTPLLEEAMSEIAKLPPDGQDALAALLLNELRATQKWDARFAGTQDVLERLADAGAADVERGDVVDFDPDQL